MASLSAHHHHFAALKIAPTRDLTAVRKAYRRRALELHPDKSRGSGTDATAFHAVQEAWEVLQKVLSSSDVPASVSKAGEANEQRAPPQQAPRERRRDGPERGPSYAAADREPRRYSCAAPRRLRSPQQRPSAPMYDPQPQWHQDQFAYNAYGARAYNWGPTVQEWQYPEHWMSDAEYNVWDQCEQGRCGPNYSCCPNYFYGPPAPAPAFEQFHQPASVYAAQTPAYRFVPARSAEFYDSYDLEAGNRTSRRRRSWRRARRDSRSRIIGIAGFLAGIFLLGGR